MDRSLLPLQPDADRDARINSKEGAAQLAQLAQGGYRAHGTSDVALQNARKAIETLREVAPKAQDMTHKDRTPRTVSTVKRTA
jgi:hypothetical protein